MSDLTRDGEVFENNLTARLNAGIPQPGYKIAWDTSNASFIFILEAPIGTADSATGWQGVRFQLDTNGNIVGDEQINTGSTLTFQNRATDSAWTS